MILLQRIQRVVGLYLFNLYDGLVYRHDNTVKVFWLQSCQGWSSANHGQNFASMNPG
jgi:hypothetical protein